jgi:glycosyltransferase involved in cell wall biosynthesis
MTVAPRVSVVIPCLNEEGFIGACVDSVLGGGYAKDRLEVLVVDGLSSDRTRSIVACAAADDACVKLIDNPARTTPVALNIGVRHATGDVIAILGAHTVYPDGYLSTLVHALYESGADGVGGVCITRPADESAKARAIAAGVSHPFGVGNSYFRIGARARRWVDTVPFGCYRRELFNRIGLFDEDLVRNQDDEFNGRVVRGGGRLLLVPEVQSEYFARPSIGTLWRMYYQYGYFKPLAARRIGRVMTLRQVAAPVFAAFVLIGTALLLAVPIARIPVALVLALYVGLDVTFAIGAIGGLGPAGSLWLALVFPVLHLAYGFGSLKGFVEFVLLNRRPGPGARALAPSR